VLGPPEAILSSSIDVLFVYGRIGADGSLGKGEPRLRELIRDSGAKVVVLASSNEPRACMNAAPNVGYGRANLVLTIERKGVAFRRFFAKLFTMMYAGDTMPVAWAKLAPQTPSADHPDVPAAIFGAELGQLTFTRSRAVTEVKTSTPVALSETLERKVSALWTDQKDRDRVRRALAEEVAKSHGSERVPLAILKLCDGSVEKVMALVAEARLDYRDILMAAEHPTQGAALLASASPGASAADRARYEEAEQLDRQQYDEWVRSR
jgi:hypothetical protein